MEAILYHSNNYTKHLYFIFPHEIYLVDLQFFRHTHGSLFSSEPNMIMDLRAFQSWRTLSKARWANRGGSRSWSGISESETQEIRLFLYIRFPADTKTQAHRPNCRKTEAKTFSLIKAFKLKRCRTCPSGPDPTFCISSFAVSVLPDSWWSVLTVLHTLPGNSLDQEQ